MAVYEAMAAARKAVVDGNGPCLVVLHTYRISGHSRSDKNVYRTEEELSYWRERGPIVRFRTYLLQENILTEKEIRALETAADREIEDVVSWALRQPYPDAFGMEDLVYV